MIYNISFAKMLVSQVKYDFLFIMTRSSLHLHQVHNHFCSYTHQIRFRKNSPPEPFEQDVCKLRKELPQILITIYAASPATCLHIHPFSTKPSWPDLAKPCYRKQQKGGYWKQQKVTEQGQLEHSETNDCSLKY